MKQNKIIKQDEAQKDRNGKAWVVELRVLNKVVREYQCLADELVRHMSNLQRQRPRGHEIQLNPAFFHH